MSWVGYSVPEISQ